MLCGVYTSCMCIYESSLFLENLFLLVLSWPSLSLAFHLKSKGYPMKSLYRHIRGKGVSQTCLQSVTRKVWVVRTMLRSPYSSKDNCTGGWVGLGPVWTHGKSCCHWVWSPDHPACNKSLYHLHHPGHNLPFILIVCLLVAYSCTLKLEDHSFLQNIGTYLPKCMTLYGTRP